MKLQRAVWILLAIASALVVVIATRWGAGVAPDSVAYLSAAESIAAGRGAMEITAEGWRPLTHFPPLYPLVLAAGVPMGVSPVIAARVLNALLLPSFILLAAFIAFRGSERSFAAAILAAVLLLASRDAIATWCMAWSEPLFLLLLFAFFAMFARSLERDDTRLLVAAAFVAAACVLVRHVGIAVVGTGAIAILLWGGGSMRRRFGKTALFTAVAIVPIVLWFLRNAAVSGSATSAPPAFHPLPFGAYYNGAENLWLFLTRGWDRVDWNRIPRNLQVLAAAFVLLFFLAAGLWERRRGAIVAPLLALFVIVYLATFSAAGAALYILVFDDRLLLPVTLTGAVLVVMLLIRWTAGKRLARTIIVTLIAVHALLGALAVRSFVAQARADGLGYNSRSWRRSPLIARVARLPRTVSLCTNADDAVWFLTRRHAATLPAKRSPMMPVANPIYSEELQRGCGDVVAWFSTVPWRDYLPTREELLASPALQEIAREKDGSLFVRRR